MDIKAIIEYLDNYITRTGRLNINPVEANAILARAGLLSDSRDRPGKPIRELCRTGKLPHAFQSNGKGSGWTIPHSSKPTTGTLAYSKSIRLTKIVNEIKQKAKVTTTVNIRIWRALVARAGANYFDSPLCIHS